MTDDHGNDAVGWSGERVRRLLAQKDLACERYQRTIAQALGISELDVKVLVCVARQGEITPSLLALRAGVSRATLGPLLSRLAALELLVRRPNPRDGRSVVVALTPRAADLLETRFAGLAMRIDAVFEALPARERQVVGDYLRRLADASAEAALAAESAAGERSSLASGE